MTGDGSGPEGRSNGPQGGEAERDGAIGDGTRIRQLDRRTIDRIAAGEVVERPASAVKELLENALDAHSSRVSVAVEKGGIEGVRVTDTGLGMSEEGVKKAIGKHTTSKISSIEDLERGVSSLGFRGEALAAIGAVSRVSIRTKPRGGTRGTELVVRGGEVESVSPTGCPAGTVVEITDLFYNVPARKKYLKQATTEFAHVNRIVTGYALANPDVAITLSHDGREAFTTSGSGNLREAVLSTYGREVASGMIPLDGNANSSGGGGSSGSSGHSGGSVGDGDGGDTGDEATESDGDDAGDIEGSIEVIEGLVSDPETTRANASYVTTIVNGRYVTAKVLREAIIAAYGSQLAPDRYPFAVLGVELPPEEIDVNVHPRKMEVRFEDEGRIKERVETCVERALLNEGLVRSGAPRGRSAPTQTRIDPEPQDASAKSEGAETRESEPLESEPRERDATTSRDGGREGESGTGESARDEDGATESNRRVGSDTEPQGTSGTSETTGTMETDRLASTDGDDRTEEHEAEECEETASTRDEWDDSVGENTGMAVDLEGVVDPHAHIDERAARSSKPREFDASEQRALSGEAVDDSREFDRLPSLRVLGQLNEMYVACETTDGLVLIDQHAADERVTYERLRERLPRGEAQMLAEPVTIELTAGEAALFDSHIDTLAGLGFYASWAADGETEERTIGMESEQTESERTESEWTESERTESEGEKGRTVEVRTVPAAISEPDPALVRDVLAEFVSADRPGKTIDAAADALLADLACYPSITAGTSLSAGSTFDLLDALDACENPYSCPHGRPVVIEFSHREIEARFERDYPGHAGRRAE